MEGLWANNDWQWQHGVASRSVCVSKLVLRNYRVVGMCWDLHAQCICFCDLIGACVVGGHNVRQVTVCERVTCCWFLVGFYVFICFARWTCVCTKLLVIGQQLFS